MRKSCTWVKSVWKQVLEREGIEENSELRNRVSYLVQSIKHEIKAEDMLSLSNPVEEIKKVANGEYAKAEEGKREELADELGRDESACALHDLSERQGQEIKRVHFNRRPHNKREVM